MSAGTDELRTAGGGFLAADAAAADVFTREDLSPAQRMFGRVAEDFMRAEVLPREREI